MWKRVREREREKVQSDKKRCLVMDPRSLSPCVRSFLTASVHQQELREQQGQQWHVFPFPFPFRIARQQCIRWNFSLANSHSFPTSSFVCCLLRPPPAHFQLPFPLQLLLKHLEMASNRKLFCSGIFQRGHILFTKRELEMRQRDDKTTFIF